MKLTRISSSSTVHGPLFIPIFVQHGVVFLLTGFISAVFNHTKFSLYLRLGFRDLSKFLDWLASFFSFVFSLSLPLVSWCKQWTYRLFAYSRILMFGDYALVILFVFSFHLHVNFVFLSDLTLNIWFSPSFGGKHIIPKQWVTGRP